MAQTEKEETADEILMTAVFDEIIEVMSAKDWFEFVATCKHIETLRKNITEEKKIIHDLVIKYPILNKITILYDIVKNL